MIKAKEVLDLFEKVTGKNAPVEIVNTMAKAFESEIWVCDTSYAKEKYDFEVKYTLEEGIKEFLKLENVKLTETSQWGHFGRGFNWDK